MTIHDRRTFLKCAAMLAAAVTARYVSPAYGFTGAQAGKQKPLEMLALGDSVMWGQGLTIEHKFSYGVKEWIEGQLNREVRLRVQAHSGATILKGNKEDKNISYQAYHGEVPSTNPTILKQVDLATGFYCDMGVKLEDVDLILLDGGINDVKKVRLLWPRTKIEKVQQWAQTYCGDYMKILLHQTAKTFPNARIMVTGYFPLVTKGTDPDFLKELIMMALGHSEGKALAVVQKIKGKRDKEGIFEKWVRLSNVWHAATNDELVKAVNFINQVMPLNESRPVDAQRQCERVEKASGISEEERKRILSMTFRPKEAAAVGASTRAVFVPVDVGDDNGYAAKKSYLWSLVRNDKTPACTPQSSLSSKLDVKSDDELFERRSCLCADAGRGKKIGCLRAGAFHPNKEGAEAYRKAIIAKLEALFQIPDIRKQFFTENA